MVSEMAAPNASELDEFADEADAWFKENTPPDPGFMLPLTFLEVGTQQQFDFLRAWQRKVYEAGYLGTSWPVEYGGRGLHPDFQRVATQAMRKYDGPIIMNAIGLGWVGPLLLDTGPEEARRAYIQPMLSAEEIWCQGYSEPEHGSDLGSVQTRAERDGDDYIINGSKIWTSLGGFADRMILLARTSNDGPSKYAGLTFFLSPMKIDGIETRPIKKITGEYGFFQCFFTDARIPASGRMGEEGQGWSYAMKVLEYERGSKTNPAGGYMSKNLDVMSIVDLARKSRRGGKPVLDDPVMRDRLVQYLIDIKALEHNHTRRRMAPLNQDRPHGLAMISKLAMTEMVRELTEFSLQFQGADAGYYVGDANAVDDGFWHRNYLNSFSATIGGGTSEIMRNIVGEHVLSLPKTR